MGTWASDGEAESRELYWQSNSVPTVQVLGGMSDAASPSAALQAGNPRNA